MIDIREVVKRFIKARLNVKSTIQKDDALDKDFSYIYPIKLILFPMRCLFSSKLLHSDTSFFAFSIMSAIVHIPRLYSEVLLIFSFVLKCCFDL